MVDRPKDAFYAHLARMGKAVAAPRRLELVDLLGQAPRTVEALAELTGMSVANTSQHLQVLRAAGLVEASKEGLFVTCRLASDDVAELFLRLRRLAEARLVELEDVKRRFFGSTEHVDIISGKQLLERVRRGQVIVLDVRPLAEYAAGHLKGAMSMPHDEVKRRFGELPKNCRVVAYCRGPYCVYAAEAVKVLRARGFDAVRIEDGVSEWRAQGLPIETVDAGARA
jgi:rhodanese-related sulfurtransferase